MVREQESSTEASPQTARYKSRSAKTAAKKTVHGNKQEKKKEREDGRSHFVFVVLFARIAAVGVVSVSVFIGRLLKHQQLVARKEVRVVSASIRNTHAYFFLFVLLLVDAVVCCTGSDGGHFG